jgi:hypothetical protein
MGMATGVEVFLYMRALKSREVLNFRRKVKVSHH